MKRSPAFDASVWRRGLWPLWVRWRTAVIDPGKTPDRFLLWADAVGGYLVCLGNEIVLGQPVPEAMPEVPILGDVSRRHAVIRRSGESYSLEAVRPVRIEGKAIVDRAALRDGCEIELGEGVRLRFRRPHALSATARLEFISRHRTWPSTDAVLLMAEAAILGPAANSHIVAPRWKREVVLFRQEKGLACRTSGKIVVDGVSHSGRASLRSGSRVEGEEFAFSLEELSSGERPV